MTEFCMPFGISACCEVLSCFPDRTHMNAFEGLFFLLEGQEFYLFCHIFLSGGPL